MTTTNKLRFIWRIVPLIFLAVFLPSAAFGHHLPPGFEEIDEFETHHALVAGLHHPFTGWEHMLVAMAAGCLAALAVHGRKLLPVSFMAALLAGGFAGASGLAVPGLAFASLTLLSVAALLTVSNRRGSGAMMAASVCGLGFAQGNAHVLMVPIHAMIAPYAAGFATGTVGLLLVGYLGGLLLKRLASVTLQGPASVDEIKV